MQLAEYLADRGRLFFRVRSYVPLLILPLAMCEWERFTGSLGSAAADALYTAMCASPALLGESIRIATLGYIPRHTSGRNVTAQRADFLNTTGMYSITRNPLYLGNFFMGMGVVLLFRSAALAVAAALLFAVVYVPIIMAEERYLREKFGEAYAAYIAATPCFLPRPALWKPWDSPWYWRTVLRREPDTVLAAVATFAAAAHARVWAVAGRAGWDAPHAAVLAAVFAVWCVLKILKKKTVLLKNY